MNIFFGATVAFSIGHFEIYWYSILAILGFVSATILIRYLLKYKKQNYQIASEILLVTVPCAIIGARVWYTIFTPGTELFAIRDGGLAWHGGLVATILGLLVYCYFRKVSFWIVADVCAVAVPLGHSFGRIGNTINREIYGNVTNSKIPLFTTEINGVYYQNIAFYEMLLLLVLCVGLFLWYRKNDKTGRVMPFYLIGYGIIRLIMEPMRSDTFIMGVNGFEISIFMSVLLIIAGIASFIYLQYYEYKKEPKDRHTYSLMNNLPKLAEKTKKDNIKNITQSIDAIDTMQTKSEIDTLSEQAMFDNGHDKLIELDKELKPIDISDIKINGATMTQLDIVDTSQSIISEIDKIDTQQDIKQEDTTQAIGEELNQDNNDTNQDINNDTNQDINKDTNKDTKKDTKKDTNKDTKNKPKTRKKTNQK